MDLPSRIGRYEVELTLGQGQWTRVLLGRDTVIGRQVAIKVLREDMALDPAVRASLAERLGQEARAAAMLSHPVLATLLDMGDDADANVDLYLVFELIHGPTLREKLQRGPLGPAEAAQVARALGAALTFAHAAGIVHRNVRPENVMLPPTGPKLTDLCLSPPGPLAGEIVRATPVVVSSYCAPETLASGSFTPMSDQFAMAATLFEALTGQRPFPGASPLSVAARVATGKQSPPTSLLPGLRAFPRLDGIFDRALAKDPRNRFPSCDALGLAIAFELEGTSAASLLAPEPRSSIVPRATRRWQNTIALVAVAVIFSLAAVGPLRRQAEEGISLKSVAIAFATSVAGKSQTSSATRHLHPLPALPPSISPSAPAIPTQTALTPLPDLPGPTPQAAHPPDSSDDVH